MKRSQKRLVVRPDVALGALVALLLVTFASVAGAGGAATGMATRHRPSNSSLPLILGTAQAGQMLRAAAGSWRERPTQFSFQWRQCDTAGTACTDISRATDRVYAVRSSNVGHALRVVVTATNRTGRSSAPSMPTTAVTAAVPDAPVNTARPAVTGAIHSGALLMAQVGSWTGAQPITYGYQWRRCDAHGGSCQSLSANQKTYSLQTADLGHALRVTVTAQNSVTTSTALSYPTPAVPASTTAAPQNTSEPRIVGTPADNNTLTASNGSWTGSPTSFAYHWLRCPKDGGASDGSNCGVIANADKSSYRVRAADVGFRLRVRVTASNNDGSASATSNATSQVGAAAKKPANASPPTITGSATVGSTLTANQGTWTGSQLSFSYSWQRCDKDGGSCASISGATDKTYTLKDVDKGNTLRVRVTAKNGDGSASATSTPTALVGVATQPAVNGCPSGSGALNVNQLSAPARLLIDGQQLSPSLVTRSTTTLTVRFHVSACNGRPVTGALIYVTGVPYNQFTIPAEQSTGSDGWATLTLHQLRGFPAARTQKLLVLFARARKAGENPLGGISTRRLVSFPVRLNG